MTVTISSILRGFLFLSLLFFVFPFYHHGYSYRLSNPKKISFPFQPPLRSSMGDDRILAQVESVYGYAKAQTIRSLIEKDEVIQIIEEIRGNESFLKKCKTQYDSLFDYVVRVLQAEDRSFDELVGQSNVEKFLDSIDGFDLARANVIITTFFASPVFANMLNNLLYEGIFEFLQYLDVLGSMVENIPMFGPIRNIIVKELKRYLDTTVLGNQIKKFLLTFNTVALQHTIDFILTPSNQQQLKNAVKKVMRKMLFSQPVNVFLGLRCDSPSDQLPAAVEVEIENYVKQSHWLNVLQEQIWTIITTAPLTEVEKGLTLFYTHLGDLPLGTLFVVELNDILKASPTTKNCLIRSIQKFYNSPEGQAFRQHCS